MKRIISNKNRIAFALVALLAFSAAVGAQESIPFDGLQSVLQSVPAASGTWTSTGSLHQGRDGHTATLLLNGNVLAAGGENNGFSLNSSEFYNPLTGKWTTTGSLNIDRSGAQAVLLSSGMVLVAGGCTSNCLDVTATSELYNPATGTWSLTGALATPRAFFTLTVLKNGTVLATGGC